MIATPNSEALISCISRTTKTRKNIPQLISPALIIVVGSLSLYSIVTVLSCGSAGHSVAEKVGRVYLVRVLSSSTTPLASPVLEPRYRSDVTISITAHTSANFKLFYTEFQEEIFR